MQYIHGQTEKTNAYFLSCHAFHIHIFVHIHEVLDQFVHGSTYHRLFATIL